YYGLTSPIDPNQRLRYVPPTAPGFPADWLTVPPAAIPCKAADARITGRLTSSFPSIELTAPVTLPRRWVPYPTTTTSSNSEVDSWRVMVIFSPGFTGSFTVSNPTLENTNVSGAARLN